MGRGRYVVLFDPLDGSSNLDCNVAVGTIFSIYERDPAAATETPLGDVLQPGTRQLAAGYVLYSSSTVLAYTTGHGVHMFTLDPAIGAYVLTNASGFAFRTLAGRGATTRQWITIPLVIAVQVAFVAAVGVGSLAQVLAFNLATSFIHFAFQYGLVLARIPEWRTAR